MTRLSADEERRSQRSCVVEIAGHRRNRDRVRPDSGSEDDLVVRTAESLLENRCDIVAGFTEEVRRSRTEVLVQLELHAALLPGKSTYRSRLISAPYAIAARTSSRFNCGYASNTSSIVVPEARKSRSSDTQILVPRMHGLPKQTRGSTAILLRISFIAQPTSIHQHIRHVPAAPTGQPAAQGR